MQLKRLSRSLAVFAALALARSALAGVLPDDRADLFFSQYSGGGMKITGESALVQKRITETLGIEADYFIDKVSGASVDVLSNASVIKDERHQKTVNVEYIRNKTTYKLGFTNSTERDYISNTPHFQISQDMFGDLTTITLGFSSTRNKVGENNGTALVPNVAWVGTSQSRSYSLGLSQIITRNLIGGVTVDVLTDSGYLANPYRFIRFVDPLDPPKLYSLGTQIYPNTRTSTAVEARAKYYLPYRAAASVSYRYFRDTWGITSETVEFGYTHPLRNIWIFEGRLRLYEQGHANFYSDLFPQANAQNFMARDKELAASKSVTLGAKATYAFLPEGWKFFKRGTATLDISRIQIKYSDFRDIKDFGPPAYTAGEEPLYQFDAMIYQLYMSMFF
jgi:Protein of unknown function (DUF3570)